MAIGHIGLNVADLERVKRYRITQKLHGPSDASE